MKNIILTFIALSILISCNSNGDLADAYGNFESEDQIVTSEMPGRIIYLDVEEGHLLKKGDIVGMVDTSQLDLKRDQLLASIAALKGKLQKVEPQINLIEQQIAVLDKEKARVKDLISVEAATQKQLDDIQGKIDVLQQQITSTVDQNKIANKALLSQIPPIRSQIRQIEDQIDRCSIINPIDGTILIKFANQGEIANQVKPLYKIADVGTLYLRAYVSGVHLTSIKIGQEVAVEIDLDKDTNQRVMGTISWISDKAEFTPKTIQTKEERVNLVYAFKVKVENPEGVLKLGMPGEVYFNVENLVSQ